MMGNGRNRTTWHGPPGKAARAVLCLLGGAILALALMPRSTPAQTENLLDRISNQRMRTFEERVTQNINTALNRYVPHSQYVLSVKVIWNRDVIPATRTPGVSATKQKLPGFPIFVNSPGAAAGDDSAPPFVRMTVQVLIDETLPEYYERFIRKIVPVVGRFDASRGDQVIVLKETFPVKQREDAAPPPTLSERELMQQLGPTPALPGVPPATQRGVKPMEAAQIAYEEGRYQDALAVVQTGFQNAKTDQERSAYLGMEGSILYTLKNQDGAQASWKRALRFDPANMDVQKVMQFFDARASQ